MSRQHSESLVNRLTERRASHRSGLKRCKALGKVVGKLDRLVGAGAPGHRGRRLEAAVHAFDPCGEGRGETQVRIDVSAGRRELVAEVCAPAYGANQARPVVPPQVALTGANVPGTRRR